jgi:hypothetical protein
MGEGMNPIQLIKYRFARSINIIGWRLVSRISRAMIAVNKVCMPSAPHHEEDGYDIGNVTMEVTE